MADSGLEDRSLDLPDVDATNKNARNLHLKLGFSFFFFGLMNNVLYVIILSAALDLVPPSTPKGIIAFCNIAPSLIAKVGWPYLLRGRIRYTKRLLSCCALSVSGMLIVAAFETLSARLLGIAFASFASGLGELTFLQLSTTYHPKSLAGHAVGYFASGTGAAGLVGAGLWWELRALGVRLGVGLSALLPFIIPVTYFFVLPPPGDYTATVGSGVAWNNSGSEYTALPEDDIEAEDNTAVGVASVIVPLPGLSLSDKWRLARPLLVKYMLPLFCVYVFEYTINQGISPTLVYPVPDVKEHPILGRIVKSLRDYYPLWQLIYQAFVFLSRSSISLGLPTLPTALLPVPAVVQALIMGTLALESSTGFLSGARPESTTQGFVLPILILLIAIEGICGGLAYVNVFYRVGQDGARGSDHNDPHLRELARQEQEFRIGSIGFADSSGILLASLISMPTECHLHSNMRGADSSKVKHGVASGLKLASHVSMASATTSFYKKSGLMPDDSSDGPQSMRNLLEQIVSIDDLQESAYHAIGRTSHLDILSKSLGHFRDLRGLTFYAEDLRSLWSNRIIRQTYVTKMIWYDNADGSNNFLLLQLSSPTWERDRWLRLERRPWNSGLKGAVSWISPLIGQSLADALVTISPNPDDLMAYEEIECASRETSDKITPLSFILDVIDTVHKNCPTHSGASMSNDRLYLWIVMDAINRYHEPSTDANNLKAQSNNPYRILRPLSRKRGCKEVAEKVGSQEENSLDDWELVPEPACA